MASVDEYLERAGFTAEELQARGHHHHVADTPEDDDPRTLRGDDIDPDADGWDA